MRRCKPPPEKAQESGPSLSLAARREALPQSNRHPQRYLRLLEGSKPVSLRLAFIGRGLVRLRLSSPLFAQSKNTTAPERQPQGGTSFAGYEPAKGNLS
jgi:hypothetical protein